MSNEGGDTHSMLLKRSVRIAGHATSISLEEPFWLALRRSAQRQVRSINDLITMIDNSRIGGLSGAVRLFVLAELECRAGELEHDA